MRWAEVDLQGVVFNGHYLTYCDVCVTEYWRAIGMAYPGDFLAIGTDLYVRKASLEYHAPAVYDDELEVRTTGRAVSAVRLAFDYEIVRRPDAAVLAAGHTIHATIDRAGRPVRIPARVKELLK